MDPNKKKLDDFTNAFLIEASRRASDIVKGVNASREQIQKETEAALKIEVEEYKKNELAKIQSREGSRVSAQMLENKRTLLNYREQCGREIIGSVIERIKEFEQSDKYPEHLIFLFEEAQKELKRGVSITVLLRKEDMQYAERIRQAAQSISITFKEGKFTLGGLVILCPSANLRIDQTFDSSLENMRAHFAELSGIDLE